MKVQRAPHAALVQPRAGGTYWCVVFLPFFISTSIHLYANFACLNLVEPDKQCKWTRQTTLNVQYKKVLLYPKNWVRPSFHEHERFQPCLTDQKLL